MKGRSLGLALIAGAVLLGGSGVEAQAPPTAQRIGYIDLARVLARSSAGVAAREQLEREKAAMQKEMDGKRVELDKLRDELEKKGSLMATDARRDREEAMERKRRDATRLADDFQRELGRKEQVLAQKVMQDISGVIERVGKQKGYYLVLERARAGVLFSAPEADLTDDVIKAYDQESATKGKK